VNLHDGSPFEAQAAVTALEHLRTGTLSQDAYGSVAAIAAMVPHSVLIILSQCDDAMLYLIGTGRSYMVSPAAIAAGTLCAAPSGSGPHVLDAAATVPTSADHFTKVMGHWDTDRYPRDRVVIRPMLDPTARQNPMLSARLEVISGNPNDLDQAQRQGWNFARFPARWAGMQITDRTGGRMSALGGVQARQAPGHAFDGADLGADLIHRRLNPGRQRVPRDVGAVAHFKVPSIELQGVTGMMVPHLRRIRCAGGPLSCWPWARP